MGKPSKGTPKDKRLKGNRGSGAAGARLGASGSARIASGLPGRKTTGGFKRGGGRKR